MKSTTCLLLCLLLIICSHNLLAQKAPVKGSVTDGKSPLSGVSVLVKGSSTGVATDESGGFNILAATGDTLVFSYSGFASREFVVTNPATTVSISLQQEATALEGVVVIGYGTKKRQHLSGSVSTVGTEIIQSRPVTNVLSAMQGEIPGVTIQRSSGQPGAEGLDLNVRGFSSVNGGNSPLVLIDGVAGDLNLLNPDDIESLTVLKDASASIYGARAAGGVMLVTTKKGKRGTPRVSYSGNVGITKLAGMMEAPTNYQFAIMDNEANIHAGAAPMYTPEMLQKIRSNDPNPIPHPIYGGWMLFFNNTDWKEALYTNGFIQKHNINISGGGNSSTYYLSASYMDQDGVIRYADDNNKRYNLRLNYDYDISRKIRLETKVSLEHQKRSDVGGVGNYIITEGIFGMPNHPVYTQDGQNFFAQGGWGNAVAMAKEGATATYHNRNMNVNLKLIAEIARGLKVNLQGGVNYSNANSTDIANSFPLYTWDNSAIAYYSIANPDQTSVARFSAENVYRNLTGYLTYNRTFNGKHEIDAMAGISHEEADYDEFGARRTNFPTNEVWAINVGSTTNMTNSGGGSHWAIRSLFSRLGYIYDNKYIVEANLRYDGSSRFHSDTRWGLFPGLSVAWRLTQENFMKSQKIFDDIKIRASYGETGNQEGINLYDYYQLITIGRPWWYGNYPFGAGLQGQSAFSDTIVSIDRTWETIATKNIGIDLSLLQSRLSFSFDYFVKHNKDMLIPVTYPSMLGAIPPFSNSGEMKTWGFETSIGWRDHVGQLEYSAKVILSDSRNEVINYGGQDTYQPGLNFVREGYPLNTYFAYVYDGVIRTQKELDDYKQLGGVPGDIGIGDAKFRDVNGDGRIDAYSDEPGQDGDVVNVGNTLPRYNYGINLNAKFKNFDIGIFFQGIGKRTLFREGEYSIPWSDWWRQPPAFYYGMTWNEDRPDAPYPKLSHGGIRYWNYQKSTLQQIDAAYIRLKNLQIGYTLPVSLVQKVRISHARIYLSGENLWEHHNVKGGWDPESGAYGFNYPFQRVYSAGLDITF